MYIHMPNIERFIWKMYTHICDIYEVTAINHVIMGIVHISDIHHLTSMVATSHIYVPLHCYSSAPIVHTVTM